MRPTSSVIWFASHELRLSWRDFYAMLSGNRPGRGFRIASVIGLIAIGLHLLAYAVLSSIAGDHIEISKQVVVIVTALLLLPVSLMGSQAMESITRAFYTRSDLELILASPTPATRIFAIRMISVAVAVSTLTLLVSAPAINVLAVIDTPGWLFTYLVIVAFGLAATSVAILLTMGLFWLIGPAKTRLIAQIVAAVVGAGFVIGIQLIAIASIGSLSRLEFFRSDALQSNLPSLSHPLWMPALGATGDFVSVCWLLLAASVLFTVTILLTARHYSTVVLKASSIDLEPRRTRKAGSNFSDLSIGSVLKRKEWKLLLRDKWLISQTLMQLLYLIPPAFMLWQGFGQGSSPEIVVVPVIVMAAGQLAGGLAWLAISGEDAPELVATAPVLPVQVLGAKVMAILTGVGVCVAPLVVFTLFLSVSAAFIAIITIAASVLSATMIQLWFRTQAKRSNFRRRQTSSRLATVAEAFSSILWAGAAGVMIAGSWMALPIIILIGIILTATWAMSPARQKTISALPI